MSYLLTTPGGLQAAASDVAGIGSSLSEAHAAAAAPTSALIAAAEDEVSAAIASLFSSHAQQYQALSAQAAAFHAEFVQALNGAGGAYGTRRRRMSRRSSPWSTVRWLLVNAPTEAAVGRPLIGNGANGAAGTGQAGGAGGILCGNGGNGGSGVTGTSVRLTAGVGVRVGLPGCSATAVMVGRAGPVMPQARPRSLVHRAATAAMAVWVGPADLAGCCSAVAVRAARAVLAGSGVQVV